MGYVIQIKPYAGVGLMEYLTVGAYGSLRDAIMFKTKTEATEYMLENCEDESDAIWSRFSVQESYHVTAFCYVDGKIIRNDCFEK